MDFKEFLKKKSVKAQAKKHGMKMLPESDLDWIIVEDLGEWAWKRFVEWCRDLSGDKTHCVNFEDLARDCLGEKEIKKRQKGLNG